MRKKIGSIFRNLRKICILVANYWGILYYREFEFFSFVHIKWNNDCVQWSFRYWKGVIIMFCAHTVNVMQISHVFDTLLPEVVFEVGKKWSLTVNDGFVGCSFVFKCFVVQLLQLWSLIFFTSVCGCWLVERNHNALIFLVHFKGQST